ncbi:hypothetical protein [Pantoea deleyi]|uniref:hypothetical protein n=1 Tax=Pantoea deleyi TaxID=470932 RepID=UPI00111C3603|nr:hypothetical protein [Pantoea deleyi]
MAIVNSSGAPDGNNEMAPDTHISVNEGKYGVDLTAEVVRKPLAWRMSRQPPAPTTKPMLTRPCHGELQIADYY